MDILESYYGKQTFLLYSLFGKVPGTRAWPRKIFLTFTILLLFLATVYQFLKLVEERFRREVIIELFPTITVTGGTLVYVPYIAFATEKEYEALISIMLNDLRAERTEEEDAIKREYANSAKILINALTLIFAVGLCGMPLSGLLPNILDLLLFLNETHERQLFIKGEMFVDQEKYFYYIYFVESCVIVVVAIAIGASENMSVIIGQHYCGMVEVLGTRLKNITRIEDHKLLDNHDYALLVSSRLKGCISGHQTILQFGAVIDAFYDVPLTLILIGTFASLTVSLVQITDPELINMMMVCFTILQVVQLFMLSYMGQCGTDATRQISVYAYDTRWYLCPPKAQKFLQFMILRSSKNCMVMASSMYTLTLANFMSVMQTVTSFYMVLRHTQ